MARLPVKRADWRGIAGRACALACAFGLCGVIVNTVRGDPLEWVAARPYDIFVPCPDGLVDARLVLSGAKQAAGSRPDIYMGLKGPIAAPTRSIDLTALSGWLTLRGVENQARQLREIERVAPKPEAPPAVEAPQPPAVQPLATQRPAAPIFAPVRPALRAPAAPGQRAPALPPPLDISPLPAPAGTARPEVSVNPQN